MGLHGLLLVALITGYLFAITAQQAVNPARSEGVGKARLCVHVVDEQGVALSDAQVRFYRELPERLFASAGEPRRLLRETCLEMPEPGVYWILSEAPGKARASTRVAVPQKDAVLLALQAAWSLSVRVKDTLGNPIKGVTVLVRASDPLPCGKLTRSDGEAKFTRLPKAPWTVSASAPGYETVVRNQVSSSLSIVLERLASLDVRVLDSSGRPIAGAGVLIAGSSLWPARRAPTNSQGVAAIRGLEPGSYDLRAIFETQISSPLHGFEVVRGASETLTLALEPGRMITAVVTEGEASLSAPVVADADVVLVEDGIGSFPLHGRTGARGLVTLGPIAAGAAATLAARAPDFTGSPLVSVPIEALEAIPIPLVRGAVLHGEVTDQGGHPIAGASVEVVGTDRFGLPIAETPASVGFRASHFAWSLSGPPALVPMGELGVIPGPVPPIPRPGSALDSGSTPLRLSIHGAGSWTTRATGEFVAKPVTPGKIRALIRHPDFVEGQSELLTLPPGGHGRVKVVLFRGGRLEGRVLDERGFPVPGAPVGLLAQQGATSKSLRAEEDGSFAFAAVPRQVTLWAARPARPERVVARRSVSVPEGERIEVELVIPALRDSVRFRVVDDRDSPIDLVELRVQSLDPRVSLRTTLFTDVSGFAELDDARGLGLRLFARAPGFAPATWDVSTAPAEVRVSLDPGVLVQGRVTQVRGRRSTPNAVVTLRTNTETRSERTDEQGTFQFSHVLPGPAEILVSHPDFAQARQEVEIGRPSHAQRPFEIPSIDLMDPAQIEGRVLNSEEQPVFGARVAIDAAPELLPQGPLPSNLALTDRDGAFVLGRLPAGSVRVHAYLAGVGRGSVDSVVLEAGGTVKDLVIRLREPDRGGEALAGGGVAITLEERGGQLLITHVAERSEAERAGLRALDLLQRIDGSSVTSIEDARTRLEGPPGTDLLLQILRRGEKLLLAIKREPVRR